MIKYKLTLIVSLLMIMSFISCSTFQKSNTPSELLEHRIKKFYSLFQQKAYDRCFTYYDSAPAKDKDEYIKYISKHNLNLTSFKIAKVEFKETLAKVYMEMSFTENNQTYHSKTFDIWILKNDTWYLKEAGRGYGPGTVEEFNFDKHFRPTYLNKK